MSASPKRSILKQDRQGVSLVEMMLVMVITAIIFAITQALLARAVDSWWKVNANADAQQQLYKAQNFLERDLAAAAYETELNRETIVIEKAPSELANLSGADGDVLWFLSAIDPVSGQFQRLADTGEPFWQRNILYYCVTPTSLNTFGYFGGGVSSGGYEGGCPFKVLIRKEIDFDTYTPPASNNPVTDRTLIEPLMGYSDILPHLSRPNGYDTAGMAGPQVSVRPISGNMLSFRADLVPSTRGVTLDLRATAIDRARREGPIGGRDLSTNPATQQLLITVFPPNQQGGGSTSSPP